MCINMVPNTCNGMKVGSVSSNNISILYDMKDVCTTALAHIRTYL